MVQQTAVQWLVDKINGQSFNKVIIDIPKELIEQANKMFDKQIKDSYKFGVADEYVIGAEQYYNETYNK